MQLEKRTWWIIGGTVIAAAIILLIVILTRSSEPEKRAFTAPAIEVENVRRGNITRKLSTVGTLKANQSVTMRAQVRGRIETVSFRGGEHVKKGEALITLEKAEYKSAHKEAQARFTLAENEFERAKKLADSNQGPQKLKEKAKAELQAAEAALERAQINLDRTVIRAPFDGLVGLQHVSPGTLVSDNQDLITFVDITPIKVDFRIAAEFAHRLSRGQELSVEVDGFKKPFPALVEAIDAQIDPNSHTLAVRGLMMNKLGLLKAGLFGRVNLSIGSKENVLLVPEGSLESDGEQTFVFRVEELESQTFAVKTPVTTGLREEGNVEIVRGLTENDRIITAGQFKIRHGYPVRITSWDDEVDVEDAEDVNEEDEFSEEEKALEKGETAANTDLENVQILSEEDTNSTPQEGANDSTTETLPGKESASEIAEPALQTPEDSADTKANSAVEGAEATEEAQTVAEKSPQETTETPTTEEISAEATPQVEPAPTLEEPASTENSEPRADDANESQETVQ
ncbi:MAG: efflux RND transporter periplasmic adaptor subunit [bacterium]|nr:efflux RND transporter periplasmic adaptor subunit [bacterium]